MKFVAISGSRNPQGQTARAVNAVVQGLKSQDAQGALAAEQILAVIQTSNRLFCRFHGPKHIIGPKNQTTCEMKVVVS